MGVSGAFPFDLFTITPTAPWAPHPKEWFCKACYPPNGVSPPPAEVLRLGFRTTRKTLGDPAGADAHHCAVRLAADLQEIGVSGSGSTFDIEHLSQVSLLAGRLQDLP